MNRQPTNRSWTTADERTIVTMRAAGHTWPEIGAVLGCTGNAACMHAIQRKLAKKRGKRARHPKKTRLQGA